MCMRLEKTSTSIFNELDVSGKKEKKSLRESRAICAGECQSTMGQMREGIGTKIKSSRQRFYKTPHFRNRWPEQNRCGESRTRKDASILSDTSQVRRLRKTSCRFEYINCPFGPQDSPLFIPLSTRNSCFANTFETYPYGWEKEGGLRPIRYKQPLPLQHFAACRSRSAHDKSSCLGRHDVTARQKRGHRRIPQRKSGVRRSPYRWGQ